MLWRVSKVEKILVRKLNQINQHITRRAECNAEPWKEVFGKERMDNIKWCEEDLRRDTEG